MAQYIFGQIDVPKLEEDESPLSPFDLSRAMKLNPANELVRTIYAFINQKVEEVRRELADADKRRRASEEAKKLADQAAEIAKVINEDFEDFRDRVAKTKAKATGPFDLYKTVPNGATEEETLLPGAIASAEVVSPTGSPGATGSHGRHGTEPRLLMPEVLSGMPNAEKRGRPAGGSGTRPKPRGGFQVSFRNSGAESDRALYVSNDRTIYINLDHPQIVAARGAGSVEEPTFRRLAYEVAFAEYAIALATELERQGEYFDLTDPIVDIRSTLNRLARKGAHLYFR
jgi:hypothetical protein